jgi:hypothetical protein
MLCLSERISEGPPGGSRRDLKDKIIEEILRE